MMDFTIVKRQIILEYIKLYGSACPDDTWSLEACIDVFRYFYRRYEKTFGRYPPRLSNKTVRSIIQRFPYLDDSAMGRAYDITPDEYPPLIDAYFRQDFENCNYSIAHFMAGDIRTLRFYEELY